MWKYGDRATEPPEPTSGAGEFAACSAVSAFRKMSPCITKSRLRRPLHKGKSWQGEPAARPPLHPLRLIRRLSLPHSHPANITRLPLGDMALGQGEASHRRQRLAVASPVRWSVPAPPDTHHDRRGVPAPWNPASPEGPTHRGLDARHGIRPWRRPRGFQRPSGHPPPTTRRLEGALQKPTLDPC